MSNLDNTASEIVAYQRDSTVQRKDLAQKTKDFRKLDDATKLAEIKGLLKGAPSFGENHPKTAEFGRIFFERRRSILTSRALDSLPNLH